MSLDKYLVNFEHWAFSDHWFYVNDVDYLSLFFVQHNY
jgi:hypothetical protein